MPRLVVEKDQATRRALGHREGPWFPVSLALIALLVISTGLIAYYYGAYASLEQSYARLVSELEEISYSVSLLVEFSNGTKIWHNETLVPIGSTLFNLTLRVIEDVEYQTMYGSVFVTGIWGARSSGNLFWLWYSWNSTIGDWILGMAGSDQYVVHEGDILAWYLADTSNYPDIPKP